MERTTSIRLGAAVELLALLKKEAGSVLRGLLAKLCGKRIGAGEHEEERIITEDVVYGSVAGDCAMPTPLQYPVERSRALQEKWLKVLHKEPPRDDDDDDDDEEEEDAADREPFG